MLLVCKIQVHKSVHKYAGMQTDRFVLRMVSVLSLLARQVLLSILMIDV